MGEDNGHPAQPLDHAIDETDVVGQVEIDRFCDHCGFNLCTLAVFCDPVTKLLLVRCTECGRIHAANQAATAGRVWLHRLGTGLLILWMLLLLKMMFWVGMGEGAMHVVMLEELTDSNWNRQTGVVEYTIRELDPRDYWFMISMTGLVSVLLPFIELSILSVAAHHLRRAVTIGAAIALPLIPFIIVQQVWTRHAPDLVGWALAYQLWFYSIQVFGGLLGAMLGRKLVRGLATALIPPKTRAALAFLWITDGKTPPSTTSKKAP